MNKRKNHYSFDITNKLRKKDIEILDESLEEKPNLIEKIKSETKSSRSKNNLLYNTAWNNESYSK